MKIKIKKLHQDAVIPAYAKDGDAGMDLTAVSKEYDIYGNTCYGTGLSFEIPKGYAGFIFPRSSNSKKDLKLTNSVGVIDSGYRGEVSLKFRNDNFTTMNPLLKNDLCNGQISFDHEYEIGDRVAQIIILPYPEVEFELTEELSQTERGSGGYGSSGK